MQHWELLCPGGLSFVCDDGLFQPSTDSFLLGSFPRLKPGLRVCDLGSGTGLLGLLLFQRQRALSVTGVELLPDAVRLAEQAAARNGLADRLIFRRGDLRKIRGLLPAGGFDLVVCNPPYYPAGSGRLPETEALRAARSETGCTLEDICTAAAWLLRWGGSFCLVHKPERLADLCCALRARGLEPKRLRLVCRRAGDAPSLLLLEARRGGRPGLDIAAPLCLEDGTGRPTAEVAKEFGLHPETVREYVREHEPELAARLGMTRLADGRQVLARSMEKYGEAVRLYETTTEPLRSIADRLGLQYNSVGGFVRRSRPDAIEAHNRLVEREEALRKEKEQAESAALALQRENEEKERILSALRQTGGNKRKAAKLLGFCKSTLYNKLNALGLNDNT